MKFSKPATSFDYQVNLLQARGLHIKNRDYAKLWLSHVSYYRLAGYWWPLQSDKINHFFKPGSNFETVIKIYEFDSELRRLIFKVIEEIEVAVRTKMIYHLSHEFGPWWFEDPANFQNQKEYLKSIAGVKKELDRNKDKETFLKQHYSKYNADSRMPPSWKTFEIVSFGTLSKLYGNLHNKCKSKDHIAAQFGVANHTYLHSWLQSISQIRNVCAHHGRLWNKTITVKPKLLSRPKYSWLNSSPPTSQHQMLYIHLCCMKYLLNVIRPDNNFTYQLYVILKKYPNIDLKALGIPKNWYKEKLWSNSISLRKLRPAFIYKISYIFRNYFNV